MNRRTFIKLLGLSLATIALTGKRIFARKPALQQPATQPSDGWQTYTVIHEKISFDLPIAPEFDFRKTLVSRARGLRRHASLGSYADGVVYTIYVFENPSPRESIDEFIKKQLSSRKHWDLSAGSKVTLDEVEGKAFTAIDPNYGHAQFFSTGDRLYQFTALGAPPDDARVKKFFSSVSLARKGDPIEISETFKHPGYPITPPATQTFTPAEVDRKVIVGLKVEPRYSEEARRNDVTGAVVLKCLFADNGSITNISIVQGLPNGLTERAIAAARKMKFVPAMKDGRYVSTWMPVEFYFTLYDR